RYVLLVPYQVYPHRVYQLWVARRRLSRAGISATAAAASPNEQPAAMKGAKLPRLSQSRPDATGPTAKPTAWIAATRPRPAPRADSGRWSSTRAFQAGTARA